MGASTFRFQQFSIEQDQCAMKVSTDGILLGAWVPEIERGRVLDIGTGTGLLALMYAQRNAHLEIDAIEIDPAAAEQARANFEASRFAERLSLHHQALQAYQPSSSYELFLCNPPYFAVGITPPENARAQARHDQSLDFDALCQGAAKLASPTAKMALIIPSDRLGAMKIALSKYSWFLQKINFVKSVPHKAPYRVLLLAGREAGKIITKERVISDTKNQYSAWFRSLTAAFYL